jgi:carboxymethylenebutenolidase
MRQGKTIELKSKDGATIDCYHVRPKGTRKGGLVLVMEIFGVTDHIREVCDSYAAEGYEVISPSLYDRQQRHFEASYSPEDIQRSLKLRDAHPIEKSIDDTQMSIDFLKSQGATPVFITGYCYGGSITWLAASRCTGLSAASAYYGRLIIDHVNEKPKCPTILHFGRNDQGIPMERVEKVAAAHPDVPVYIYEAGHGFNSDRRTDYHEPSARLARERTLKLFASVEK